MTFRMRSIRPGGGAHGATIIRNAPWLSTSGLPFLVASIQTLESRVANSVWYSLGLLVPMS
jgi:hypothetical protein